MAPLLFQGRFNVFRILLIVFFSVTSLLPIAWLALTSLKQRSDIFAFPPKLFFEVNFDSYMKYLSFGSESIQPSTRADSSSSRGMVSKNDFRIQMAKGTFIAPYTMTSPRWVSSSFRSRIRPLSLRYEGDPGALTLSHSGFGTRGSTGRSGITFDTFL